MNSLDASVHEAKTRRVTVTEGSLVVDLPEGRSISVPLVWYPGLLNRTRAERNNWRFIADGEGIHWPELDEDLSIDSLIAGKPSGDSAQSLKRWLESRKGLTKRTRSSAGTSSYTIKPPLRKGRVGGARKSG